MRPDKVIRMDSNMWDMFGSGKSRPYSLVVYFNSKTVQSGQLATLLKEMRISFGYTAASYAAKAAEKGKVFFVELDYGEDAKDVFHRQARLAPLESIRCSRPPRCQCYEWNETSAPARSPAGSV